MIKVIACTAKPGYRLDLVFSDGRSGTADLSALMARSGEMVRPLKDPAYFARVFLENGAPTWPNGFDLAPWALYEDLRKAGRLSEPQTAA